MLGTVLDKVTTLVGRAFVISAFSPVLLLAAASLATLVAIEGVAGLAWRWSALTRVEVLATAVFFVVAAAAAYVLMVISPVLKRLLEGADAVPTLRAALLQRTRREFRTRRQEVESLLGHLTLVRARHAHWREAMAGAYRRRTARRRRKRVTLPSAVVKQATDRLAVLGGVVESGWSPECAELERLSEAVTVLYDYGHPVEDVEPSHLAVLRLWGDLEKAVESDYSQVLADLQSRYAYSEGVSGVQPTALGNILAATWSYPFTRYGIDATLMWPRLQKVIPAEYFRVVEDARISYDFCVNMAFVSAVYATAWLGAAPWVLRVRPAWPYVVFPLAGVVATVLFYRAAIEAARALGAVVRTCFDLFRFPLLQELRIALPADIAAERATWKHLNDLLIFEDSAVNIPYTQPGAGAKA